jgi:hypothetical protein
MSAVVLHQERLVLVSTVVLKVAGVRSGFSVKD